MLNIIKNLLSAIKSNQIGNTLVQIPITLAVIGGVSVAGTSLADVLPEARDTRRAVDAYQITQALALYYDDELSYPIYTGDNAEAGWQLLEEALAETYIFDFPEDPSASQSYRYWSDGQTARVFWTSEVDETQHERRLF